MKLSEAMKEGYKSVNQIERHFLIQTENKGLCGCALGIASIGFQPLNGPLDCEKRMKDLEAAFPELQRVKFTRRRNDPTPLWTKIVVWNDCDHLPIDTIISRLEEVGL